ncbi:hypothetical protein F2P79_000295 [Pimephales promelas]|nr:hypothetical protein F2P79_000295 [Pimephales promelas]
MEELPPEARDSTRVTVTKTEISYLLKSLRLCHLEALRRSGPVKGTCSGLLQPRASRSAITHKPDVNAKNFPEQKKHEPREQTKGKCVSNSYYCETKVCTGQILYDMTARTGLGTSELGPGVFSAGRSEDAVGDAGALCRRRRVSLLPAHAVDDLHPHPERRQVLSIPIHDLHYGKGATK